MTSGTVLTVLGPIDPSQAGPGLLHEHIMSDISRMVPPPEDPEARRLFELPIALENLAEIRWSRAGMLSRQNIDLNDAHEAAGELADLAAAAGGRATVVEASPIGMRGDIARLPDIARRSGVNIVKGTAFFVDAFVPDEYRDVPVDALAAVLVSEFESGVPGTDYRAGIIGEIGTSSPVTPLEARILVAAARAAQATGMAIDIHLDPWAKAGLQVVDILAEAGADLSRVIIGHLNPTLPDLDYHRAIAERGCVLGYDLCGYDIVLGPGRFPPYDWETADAVAQLAREGFGERITLSMDTALKTDLLRYGGWGYAHIIRRVAPLLRERGLNDAQVQAIVTDTPTRLLTLAAVS
jgi:phosphotriesterase-related protein